MNIFVLAVHDSSGVIHANFITPLWVCSYFIPFQEVKCFFFVLFWFFFFKIALANTTYVEISLNLL